LVRVVPLLALVGAFTLPGAGAEPSSGPPDAWLTNVCQFPPPFAQQAPRSNDFTGLRAEVIAGKLKVFWPSERVASNAAVTLRVSVDEPGHWPARDWQTFPMTLRGQVWEAPAPVTDLDLPLVYFVCAVDGETTGLSPMRVCHPREAGLEVPTRLFWPFLEGFEAGLESWRLLTPDAPPLRTDGVAHTGRNALAVSLPAGRRSVTIATTRVRGWHYWKANATGVRLWLRAGAGTGRARFTLSAHAHTTNRLMAVHSREVALAEQWRKAELLFAEFPGLPLPALDLFTIEFIGEGPREFLVDDLQLLGPWAIEAE
jgi:hypothetical protein